MRCVDVDWLVADQNSAQSHALASEPVAVLDFVHIAVHRPLVEQTVRDLVFGENAQAGPNHTTEMDQGRKKGIIFILLIIKN